MTQSPIILDGNSLTIERVVDVARYGAGIRVPSMVIDRIAANWNAIAVMLARGDIMYGLNTGIGGFGNVRISPDKAGELSTRIERGKESLASLLRQTQMLDDYSIVSVALGPVPLFTVTARTSVTGPAPENEASALPVNVMPAPAALPLVLKSSVPPFRRLPPTART